MIRSFVGLFSLLALSGCASLLSPATAQMAKCKMTFDLAGWSLVYKQMKGEGKVTCSNGQRAKVAIKSHGGGFTIGKSDILGGTGTFSEVKDISEIFGTYAEAQAHAGATKGAAAQVMTKGEVSLSLAGTGRGWDVGIAFGGFTIEKK